VDGGGETFQVLLFTGSHLKANLTIQGSPSLVLPTTLMKTVEHVPETDHSKDGSREISGVKIM
jgi:hypothetical protein